MDEKRLRKLLYSIEEHAYKIRELQQVIENELGIDCCYGVMPLVYDKMTMQVINGINDIMEILGITEYTDRNNTRTIEHDELTILQVANKETGEFD